MIEDEAAVLAAENTTEWTIPAGYKPKYPPSHCRSVSCGAAILWCETPKGARAPINPDGTSHFATCPAASDWRRK